MKHILAVLISIMMLLSFTYAHDLEKQYNIFSDTQKISMESRLLTFFNKVDSFESEKQQSIYTKLNTRIQNLTFKYDTNSTGFSILDMLSVILAHKLDTQVILSNAQILDHVIYGTDYKHYLEIESQEESDIVEEDDNVEPIVRDDINTQELNEYEKDILAGDA